MFKKKKKDGAADKFLTQEVQGQLRKAFSILPNDISVILFTDGHEHQEFQMARDLFAGFAQLTDRIKFSEKPLDDPEAVRLGVDRSPTLAFGADRYTILYLGVPLGEEGRTLVETLILVGLGKSQLSEQARRVLARLEEDREIKVFVSPTCPYCPQQAVNAVKAAIERPDRVRAIIVDTHFNQDLASTYSAFSVPQTWANEVQIGQGAQPEELFAASLESLEELSYFIPESDAEEISTDLLIVGGGPAGLTAAIYAARSGLNAAVVEQGQLGGQMALTPVVENYPGLAHVGGKNLVDIMVAHALDYVPVFPREKVMELEAGDPIRVTTTLRRFNARAVLLATGAKHRRLGAEGEERLAGRGVSYCSTCDGPLFKGLKVALVGGGNTAVTEALHLVHIGVDVTLIHRRDSLRAQEHLVKDLQDKGVPIIWNTEVVEIRGERVLEELVLHNNQTEETSTAKFDGLFVAIGYEPETETARMAGVELAAEGYIRHDGRHRTNVRGVYSAGDVEGGFKQIVTAAGAGAGAAMTIFEDLTSPYWTRKEQESDG